MRVISAEEVHSNFDFPSLIEVLRQGFQSEIKSPVRHHHLLKSNRGADNHLLLMPAWHDLTADNLVANPVCGVKLVTVSPDNQANYSLPSVFGSYVLSNADNGVPLAVIDGVTLTLWRTAAASALASSFLSRPDASSLTMIGAGSLASYLIKAHCSVRPIKKVRIWNRSQERAEVLAKALSEMDLDIQTEQDRSKAISEADIVSSATISSDPLVEGQWVKSGTHIDLVGAFQPTLRESDDDLIVKCSLFCDTREGVFDEGGDIIQPLEAGLIEKQDVLADLYDLTRGVHNGRKDNDEITVFKSVGAALEDLVAAQYLFEKLTTSQ